MNYYRRYVGDYMGKTMRLSLTEHGAYSMLLDYYYALETPLPLDHGEIYVIARAVRPEDQRAVDKVLRLFFIKGEGGYHNKRADEELAIARTARENGSRGGRPRTQGQTRDVTEELTQDETRRQTGRRTQKGGGSGHPPTTNHQPPTATRQPRAAKKPVALVALPEWMNAEKFRSWITIRPAKARTTESQKAAIEKLERFRAQGFDPNAIVGESLANGWQGIFPPKDGQVRSTRTVGDANRAAADEAARRYQEEHGRR